MSANETVAYEVVPLTPIWTAGVKGCDRIHETAIIGSLRFWYETVIRALGGQACSPIDKDYHRSPRGKKCGLETTRTGDIEKLCPACRMFGCTGWSRKFFLRVKKEPQIQRITASTHHHKLKRTIKIPIGDFWGPLTVEFRFLKKCDPEERQILRFIWETLLAKYVGMGGKVAQGGGLFRVVNLKGKFIEADEEKANEELKDWVARACQAVNAQWNDPDFELNKALFREYSLEFSSQISSLLFHRNVCSNHEVQGESNIIDLWGRYGVLPIAHEIRRAIRGTFTNQAKRHHVFGSTDRNGDEASHVSVSHCFREGNSGREVHFRVAYFLDDGFGMTDVNAIEKNLLNKSRLEGFLNPKGKAGLIQNLGMISGKSRTGEDLLRDEL
ncbi:MAG: type III-B CRISPR module RAMP protein Cmr1 [Candidatus Abyssobacteria bacterium SURF_17]|uniref:Type III-B CRISPR module RAMP protein Cmr1 n=1 Tax=Candidatus Abyssobacteria bacterium SURF_17 TaxID=2093361 RepID=A0A419F3N8_9BACT|nr:MAG: type III-B CRISPR module RAMP protein Cmr1 [Candidatus Abyssubacteria bacterium SURF_17]